MLAKLLMLILGMALIGAGVLSVRQQHIQIAHEMTATRLQVQELDDELTRLRAKIAEKTRPELVASKVDTLGPVRPIVRSTKPAKPEHTDAEDPAL